MFIILLLIISVAGGLLLRGCRPIRHLERTTTWTVWLLILVFGISLGSNETIINDFLHFGLTALLVAIAGVAGSVLLAWGLTRFINSDKKS